MSSPQEQPKPNAVVIVAMSVIAVAAIAACTVLIVLGKPIGDLLGVFAVSAAPVITYFGAQLHGTVTETRNISNGNSAAMRDALIAIAQQNNAAAASAPSQPTPPPSIDLPVNGTLSVAPTTTP